MYSFYAIIIVLIVKNCCGADIIRLDDIKFQVNGAPTVAQANSISATSESVQVLQEPVVEDKKTTAAVTSEAVTTKKNGDVTELNIAKTTEVPKNNKPTRPNKLIIPPTFNPTFKVTVLEDIDSTLSTIKEITDNTIETRRKEALNVYVPISEDINMRDYSGGNVKGFERSGLSLLDLNENVLRMPKINLD